ncbi:MAG: hypothetical protein J0653_04180, partial [Deltaproteobacteria bacterium]|nr:hypothetical protein [Deltaproteobacteria bacterium]
NFFEVIGVHVSLNSFNQMKDSNSTNGKPDKGCPERPTIKPEPQGDWQLFLTYVTISNLACFRSLCHLA